MCFLLKIEQFEFQNSSVRDIKMATHSHVRYIKTSIHRVFLRSEKPTCKSQKRLCECLACCSFNTLVQYLIFLTLSIEWLMIFLFYLRDVHVAENQLIIILGKLSRFF